MEATIWPDRIDILGAGALPNELWKPLLDDLKAEHVPGLTPTGKRMSVVVSPTGGTDAFIYRTASIPDDEVIRILSNYGIPGSIGSEKKANSGSV